MNERLLLVDDDRNILASFKRQLRNHFRVDSAMSGKEGLDMIGKDGPYPVIVSDLRMPGMDGIEFLSLVREMSPNSTRIMLTGNADLKAAIEAVNEGNIFRFLTKPCPLNTLLKALTMGVEQYRLITAEKELLQKTLRGTIELLNHVLELVNPEAFGRSSRLKRYVRDIAFYMKLPDIWRLETASMLSQIGCVTLPGKTIDKFFHGQQLTIEESQLFEMHPTIASDLLGHIPRMEKIAEIVAYQEKHFDGSGTPADSLKGDQIPLGARVLKVVLDFDVLEASGHAKSEALSILKERSGRYDPEVLTALTSVLRERKSVERKSVKVSELKEHMILEDDVRTLRGRLLISNGQEVTRLLIERLRNFAGTVGIKEPIRVVEQVSWQRNGYRSEKTVT